MITAREAWITGSILGRFRDGIPGSNMTLQPATDPEGNWMSILEVHEPDGHLVARILIIDAEFADTV